MSGDVHAVSQNRLNRTAIWCGALALAILLDQWKHFFPGQYTLLAGAEPIRQAYSWLTFWRRSMLDGSWPLWDPNAWGGYAFPGEMQTAAFYPLYLLILLFRPNRFGLFPVPLYSAFFLFAHLVAALTMFGLMRHLRASRLAAFVAGFAFSSASFTGDVTWPHMLQSAIWLPAIALFLFRAFESDDSPSSIRNALLAGSFLGVSLLAGGLHIAMAQAIFVITAAAYHAVGKSGAPGANGTSVRPLAIGALVVATAAALAAIQLLPSHLYAGHSLRSLGGIAVLSSTKPPYTLLTHDSLSPRALMAFLFPAFEGIGMGEVWTPYIGVLPFLFAAIAVWKLWSKPWVPYLASLAAAVFLYTLAGMSALHGVLYVIAPFLWMAREAPRFIYLTAFCMCILAGFGLDYFRNSVLEAHVFTKVKRGSLLAMSVCLFLFLAAVFFPKVAGYWEFFSLLLILMSAVLIYHAADTPQFRASRVFPALVLSLLFFDLNAFNWTGTNKLEGASAGTEDIDVLNSLQGAAHFLRQQPSPFRVKVLYEPEPNIGDAYGVPSLTGGGVTIDRFAWKALSFPNLLNVEYLIRPGSSNQPGAVYQDKSWKVYRNPDSLPHAWIVHRCKLEPGDDQMFKDIKNAETDLRSTALVASAPAGPLSSAAPDPNESARITLYSARQIALDVNASSAGLMVLSEIFYPEWHARLNGREVKILRADQALRAISVPAGRSRVEFVYRPVSVYAGALVSLLTAAMIAAAFVSPIHRWFRRTFKEA